MDCIIHQMFQVHFTLKPFTSIPTHVIHLQILATPFEMCFDSLSLSLYSLKDINFLFICFATTDEMLLVASPQNLLSSFSSFPPFAFPIISFCEIHHLHNISQARSFALQKGFTNFPKQKLWKFRPLLERLFINAKKIKSQLTFLGQPPGCLQLLVLLPQTCVCCHEVF